MDVVQTGADGVTRYMVGSNWWVLPSWAARPTQPIAARHCRSCGAAIAWLVTTAGKLAPVNADGNSHFATCPQADAWRKGGAS